MSTPPEDSYAHLFRDPSPSASTPKPQVDAVSDSIPEPEWLSANEPLIVEDPVAEPLVAVVDEAVEKVDVVEAVEAVEIVEDVEVDDAVPSEQPSEVVVAEAAPQSPRTGRLFRSSGAPDDAAALLAVPASQASKLRTLKQGEPAPAAPLVIGALPDVVSEEVVVEREPERPAPRRHESQISEASEHRAQRTGSLTAVGAYVVVTAVTVVLALGSALIFGQAMGILTGVGLIATSVFSALAIRRNDDINAVFAPPIAYFITIVTAGQIGINVQSFSGRLVEIFFLMGTNWIWLGAAVLAALIIVALRRRTS